MLWDCRKGPPPIIQRGADLDSLQRDLSFVPAENPHPKVLTPAQIAHYNKHGFLAPFRVFDVAAAEQNRLFFDQLQAKAEAAGRDRYSIMSYHLCSARLYDICLNETILDLVEDLIGPNFVLWGSHFFCKSPYDEKKVPWHQDASYWPFDKSRTVTAWLAIDDADAGNAAMQFLPDTHKAGHLAWERATEPAANPQEIVDVEKHGKPFIDVLQAGEISLHADMLAHGSDPNQSDRRRCGLTLRYAPIDVRALTNWHEQAVICRGSDPSGHWPHHPRPDGEYY
jgi:ectoine hydroxylase-related dioxygenase (phytanoyl-CoA dioxygenase family)